MSQLELCLLSSFYTKGVAGPPGNLPDDVRRCFAACRFAEVYIMMEGEALAWADKWGTPRPVTAVQFLASLNPAQIQDVAESIHERFCGLEGQPKIAGLASFIPEIAQRPDSELAVQGIAAVRNLMNLGQALQGYGHPTHLVEMVGGSRIRDISLSNGRAFQANLTSPTDGQNDLISNLKQVVESETQFLQSLEDHPVFLALEPEPGPIFLVSDTGNIRSLTYRISGDSLLRKYVGFNLDIGHWRVARIDANVLRKPETEEQYATETERGVRDRVLHVHVNGHHASAHLGDTNPRWINKSADFETWLEQLRDIPIVTGSDYGYRGFVSLEYEAARNADDVLDAISFVRDLL